MVTFTTTRQHPPGTIASLLNRSFAEILVSDEKYWQPETRKWEQFDREVYGNQDTVGECVLVTCLNGNPIGFASFDPRQKPRLGIVGHNCILPEYRGNGHGTQQIRETLDRMQARGIWKAIVSTSEHPFFLPAQRMYMACGFQEKRRYLGGPDPRYRMVDYERDLRNREIGF